MKLDGVAQTTTTTGTGDLTLDGTVDGFRTFAQAVADGDFAWGDQVDYVIDDADAREWGRGRVLQSGPTLERTTVYGSTASGARIAAGSFLGPTRVFSATPDGINLTADDLQANGGKVPETDRANTFDASQTFRVANATPAAGEAGGALVLRTQNTAGEYDVVAEVRQVIDNGANGAEAAGVDVLGRLAGAERTLLTARSDGIAAPGYARKGVDTAHFKEVWANGLRLEAPGRILNPGYVSGEEIGPPHVLDTAGGVAQDVLWFTPIFLAQPVTAANLAFRVVSIAGTTPPTWVRLGLYSNNNGAPSALIVQTARLALIGAADYVGAVTPTNLSDGWYWAAAYWYGGSATPFLQAIQAVESTYLWRGRSYLDTAQVYRDGLPSTAPATSPVSMATEVSRMVPLVRLQT